MTIRSAEEFVRLRKSSDAKDYGRAALEEAPLEVWHEIVKDYPEMRFWVAQNKTVPVEVLSVLARDDDPRVRSMVASKRKLDPETLAGLAIDDDEGVRASVARNPRADRLLLEHLRDDPWETIRVIVEQRLAENE